MPRVTAFIPSHNEELLLPAAIRALETQTATVDHIVVVSDNSTDGTAAIAAGWGGRVELFETCGNRDRKAGALNQALDALLRHLADDDWVLVMDADSQAAPGIVARAQAAGADPRIGAVGGIFLACGERTLLSAGIASRKRSCLRIRWFGLVGVDLVGKATCSHLKTSVCATMFKHHRPLLVTEIDAIR